MRLTDPTRRAHCLRILISHQRTPIISRLRAARPLPAAGKLSGYIDGPAASQHAPELRVGRSFDVAADTFLLGTLFAPLLDRVDDAEDTLRAVRRALAPAVHRSPAWRPTICSLLSTLEHLRLATSFPIHYEKQTSAALTIAEPDAKRCAAAA